MGKITYDYLHKCFRLCTLTPILQSTYHGRLCGVRTMATDYYKVLNVKRDATVDEIRTHFIELSMVFLKYY